LKIITFSEGQSGESWLKWRRGGVTATDISVIMGSNPYETPLKLWEKKCGYRAEDPLNVAMKHGVKNEDVARQWINQNHQLYLKPLCVEDDEEPIFRASLDGWDNDNQVLCEIKCPISEKVLDNARLKQSIPDYWYDQMQWQIMISNPKRAFIALWDYRTQNCITLDMFGSKERIPKMREKAKSFWHNVQIGRAPVPEKSDYIELEDEDLHALLLEYEDLARKCTALSDRKKELKKRIEDFGDDGNFTAYGFKIQRVQPAAKLDVEQMKLDGIDVERYMKKTDSIGYYKIYLPKGNK